MTKTYDEYVDELMEKYEMELDNPEIAWAMTSL